MIIHPLWNIADFSTKDRRGTNHTIGFQSVGFCSIGGTLLLSKRFYGCDLGESDKS